MGKQQKRFFTYDQQIQHLKDKGLIIADEARAKKVLQQYSYYSCVSAYKGIFKEYPNGDYIPGTTFEDIVTLYLLDRTLRDVFLNHILIVENHLKSLYSYAFCELVGDKQQDYLNANNYNYSQFQGPVNDFITIANDLLKEQSKDYIKYNLKTYGSVPLWVLIHALTLGNISKMYEFSTQAVQSAIARGFNSKEVFPKQLVPMLKVLSKFRNTCAHNERLYSFRTKNTILDMPIHKQLGIGHNRRLYKYGKQDLFSVVICLKYLLPPDDFKMFFAVLSETLDVALADYKPETVKRILKTMGFPHNWQDIQEMH